MCFLGESTAAHFCCKCAQDDDRKFKIEDGENTTPSSWVTGFLFYSESWGIFLASFLSSMLHIIIHFCPEATSITVLVNYKATSAYESKMLHIFWMDTSRTRESETHNLIQIKYLIWVIDNPLNICNTMLKFICQKFIWMWNQTSIRIIYLNMFFYYLLAGRPIQEVKTFFVLTATFSSNEYLFYSF